MYSLCNDKLELIRVTIPSGMCCVWMIDSLFDRLMETVKKKESERDSEKASDWVSEWMSEGVKELMSEWVYESELDGRKSVQRKRQPM